MVVEVDPTGLDPGLDAVNLIRGILMNSKGASGQTYALERFLDDSSPRVRIRARDSAARRLDSCFRAFNSFRRSPHGRTSSFRCDSPPLYMPHDYRPVYYVVKDFEVRPLD